jgi:NADH-quinone oxidoreductase subunit E
MENDNELNSFIEKWQDKPGSLIMILHKVQRHYGYIPKTEITRLAKILKISTGQIYGVITFYHFFKLQKPGENIISVCTGTACYLKGANEIIAELKHLLKIGVGEVTEDGKFSLEAVRCLGCCGLAPVISIGNEIFGRVETKQLKGILGKFDK